jgi:1,4-alpha-glucan branching enzyme
VKELNEVYKATPALYTQDHDAAGFAWIDANDASGNVFSFLRYGDDGSALACIANFAGSRTTATGSGLPWAGTWREVLNTDAEAYSAAASGTSAPSRRRRRLARAARLGAAARAAAGHRLAGQ